MKANIGTFERLARAFLGLTLAGLGVIGFVNPIAQFFFVGIGVFFLFEAATGICPLYAHLGAAKPTQRLSAERLYLVALLGIQLVLAYLWFHAGYEKATGTFLADLPKTLAFFASKNPYGWYVSFLNTFAVPNVRLFGLAILWGEVFTGLGLAVSAGLIVYGDKQWRRAGIIVTIIALLTGAAMNKNFWLAAGWTGPGTAASNVAMFWPQLILAYVWIVRYMDERK